MQVTRRSILTGKEATREINCTPEQLTFWEAGRGLIQEVMPSVSPEDREFIMTGVTPEEWREIMGGEDELT